MLGENALFSGGFVVEGGFCISRQFFLFHV